MLIMLERVTDTYHWLIGYFEDIAPILLQIHKRQVTIDQNHVTHQCWELEFLNLPFRQS